MQQQIFTKISAWFQITILCTKLLLSDGQKHGKNRDNNRYFVAVLIDLSKALDHIPYSLLMKKLNAIGFDKKSRCP